MNAIANILAKRHWHPASWMQPARVAHAARVVVTLVVVILAVILGVRTFRSYEYTPWTRDGRINAYVVDSAAEVSGLVTEVAVQDNAFVHKGDLLYQIDARDYRAAVKSTRAAVDSATARLALQKEHLQRREAVLPGAVSAEERQTYAINVQASQADVESARAALYKAQVDLERCEIRSPVNGWVTNLTVRVGNFATTGQRQMSVVDADSYWVSGYFEETRLRNIRVGDTARAVLMGYPDVTLTGRVDSINRGIADANTAPNPQGLPQVNPVFTWVRLAQRIPVRIHIDRMPQDVRLAIGETCTVHIDPPRQ